MNDPIREAEHGLTALQFLEQLATGIGDGKIRVRVHNGRLTSCVTESVIDPDTVPGGGIIADLATMLGYGGLEFAIEAGRIVDYEALPKRKIA